MKDLVKRILSETYDPDTLLDFQIENVSTYLTDHEELGFTVENIEYASQEDIDKLVYIVNLLFGFAEYYRTEVPMSHK